MKRYLKIAGVICFCLLFQEAYGSENQLLEKGSKAKSEATIKIDSSFDSCSVPGPQGPVGPAGSQGEEGPQGETLDPVYASAFQSEPKNFGQPATGSTITVPFTTLDYTKGIEFDSTTDTFTLPKGIYTVRFQFLLGNADDYGFSTVFLSVGGCQHKLTWTGAGYDPGDSGQYQSLSSFTGSSIFQVPADDTEVKLCATTNQDDNDDLIFADPIDGGLTTYNYPARIVFEKVANI